MPPPKKADKLSDADIALIKAGSTPAHRGPKPGEALPSAARVTLPKIEPQGRRARPVNAVVYSPRPKVLAVARAGEVELRIPDGQALLRKLTGHKGNVNDVAFSADGAKLAAGGGRAGGGGEVRVWNVADGKLLRSSRRGPSRTRFMRSRSRPDGPTIATRQLRPADHPVGRRAGKAHRARSSGHNGASSASPSGRTARCWPAPAPTGR